MELIIECVWYSSRKDFIKFSKSNDCYDNVIDHHAISSKLSKSDVHGAEPPDAVIGIHIIKQLTEALVSTPEKKQPDKKKILYVIKNLNLETVSTLKELISSIHITSYKFNLIIINRDDYPKKGVLSSFNHVKFIDN